MKFPWNLTADDEKARTAKLNNQFHGHKGKNCLASMYRMAALTQAQRPSAVKAAKPPSSSLPAASRITQP